MGVDSTADDEGLGKSVSESAELGAARARRQPRAEVEREPVSEIPEKELIIGVFYDKKGRHEYAYTAIGFAYERVARMLVQR
jgi:hypothetical protein